MGYYDDIILPWTQWKVTERLGKGGFGAVYEAERELFGKTEKAAIKIITIPSDPDEIEEDYSDGYDYESIVRKYAGFLQNIVSEYQMMAGLKGHTNIVNCHDIATIAHKDGVGWDVYIRMELLTPLSKLLKTKMLTTEQIIKLGVDICSALVVCEKKNIVHRDIKPENILISEYGDYKLGDFGIARNMDHATAATKIGTERYIAPEVIMQDKYDKRVDIYSLGLVLHWLLNERRIPFITGTLPPSASEVRTALNRRMQGEQIPDPVNGSRELKAVVRKACAYKPGERYSSAQEMLNALQAVRKGNVYKTAEATVQKAAVKESAPQESSTQESFLNNDETIGNGWNDYQKTNEKPRVQSKAENLSGAKISSSTNSKILGIHFGVCEVCGSIVHEGKCRIIFKIPAYVAITPTGETLVGSRAVRYKDCHEKVPFYSVTELLKSNRNKSGFNASYKGANVDDIFDDFAKEIRRKLNDTQWRKLDDCILSVSSYSLQKSEKLKKHMNQTGFQVKRIMHTAVACSYSNLYNRKDHFYHIGFVMEGNNIELSFVENSDDMFEVVGLCSFTVERGKQLRTSALADLLKKKCPNYKGEIDKAEWIWYGDHQTLENNKHKNVLDVGVRAAAGAALYGAQVYGEIPGKLSLLVTPHAYRIEIIGTEGQKEHQLLKSPVIIQEQTVFPCRSKEIVYERKSEVNWEDQLVIYESSFDYGNDSGSEGTIVFLANFKALLSGFHQKPDKIGVSLAFNAAGQMIVVIKDIVCGKIKEFYFAPSYSGRSGNQNVQVFNQKQILANAWKEMKQISQSLAELNSMQKNTPVGNGLLKIEKQCKQFMDKRGMSYHIYPQNGEINSKLEETRTALAEDLLQIVDSMEYGVRSISANAIGHPERMLLKCYHSFLDFLESSMNVKPVPAEGEYFDANCHYALMHETDSKKETNIVSEELQRGYYMGTQVLRPAKVKVLN